MALEPGRKKLYYKVHAVDILPSVGPPNRAGPLRDQNLHMPVALTESQEYCRRCRDAIYFRFSEVTLEVLVERCLSAQNAFLDSV